MSNDSESSAGILYDWGGIIVCENYSMIMNYMIIEDVGIKAKLNSHLWKQSKSRSISRSCN